MDAQKIGTMAASVVLLMAGLVIVAPLHAASDAYPAKPIRLLVPSPPGASNDGVARIVANGLNLAFGRAIVVDNRPGGGGIIAAELVARARPDGYSLFLAYATFTTIPFLQKNLPYDTLKDFAPITEVANQPLFVTLNPVVPASTIKELVALSKSKPGGLMAGYTQSGSSTHLATEIFKLKTGTMETITSVSYKGGAPAMVALMSGEVQMAFATATATIPQMKSGKLKVIATSARKRLPYASDIPTLEESGVSGLEASPWQGLLAPAGTPRVIVDRIQAEVAKFVQLQDTQSRLAALGADPIASTPDEFRAKLKRELDQFGNIIPALHLNRQ